MVQGGGDERENAGDVERPSGRRRRMREFDRFITATILSHR
jgi:hypothetical protein